MTEYRRYQGKSYMVCTGDAAGEGYEYPMLAENRILGLLPFRMSNADQKRQLWYDISGRQALEDWMKLKRADSVFLKKFMTALAETIVQAGEFLLCEDKISLLPERIFVDLEERDISFCYMPSEQTVFSDSLRTFMEYYLSHMNHGDRSGVQRCYAVYEKCQQAHVPMEELLEILYEEENGEPAQPCVQPEEEKAYRTPEKEIKLPKLPGVSKERRKKRRFAEILRSGGLFFPEKKNKRRRADFYEPKEYPESQTSQTVFLGSETDRLLGELKYEGDETGTNLSITTDVFLIGSRQGEVNGVIRDETISRIHARITREEDCFYLEDLNSTNGTYRNGELLNYREKVRLEKNDRITFAKVCYRFV